MNNVFPKSETERARCVCGVLTASAEHGGCVTEFRWLALAAGLPLKGVFHRELTSLGSVFQMGSGLQVRMCNNGYLALFGSLSHTHRYLLFSLSLSLISSSDRAVTVSNGSQEMHHHCTHSHTRTHTHTHIDSVTHSLTLSHTHTHTYSLAHSHTHTHTLVLIDLVGAFPHRCATRIAFETQTDIWHVNCQLLQRHFFFIQRAAVFVQAQANACQGGGIITRQVVILLRSRMENPKISCLVLSLENLV